MALAETEIIDEVKSFYKQNGVDLDLLDVLTSFLLLDCSRKLLMVIRSLVVIRSSS